MKDSLVVAIIASVIVSFVGLFAYAKWGPAFPLSVSQITTNKNDLFTVSGEGKVTAKPDIAQVSVGFTQNGSSVGQLQSQANQTINTLTADIKKLGIADKDIKTTNYYLSPDYDYRSGSQKITGYTINVSLDVKVRDFDKINSVIDTATADGANQIGALNFAVDNPEQYQSQARKLAIDAAKTKAAEIASETGISLGRIVSVTEGTSTPPRPMPLVANKVATGLGAGTPTQVEPGSSEITVTVTLAYETR